MATLMKADGEVVDDYDVSSLDKLQEAVGGYIEIVTIDKEMCLIVNEEGLIMNLKKNMWASLISNRNIVGDVLFMKRNEMH
jgi:hypothetical protein